MTTALYDKGRQAFLEGSVAILTDTIRVALVKNTYSVNLATHQFYSDLGANVYGTRATDPAIGSKTSTAGVFNGASVTWTAVTNGTAVGSIVIYKDTGADGTSPLLAYIDTDAGLPFTASGADVTQAWDTGANKVFKL